MLVSPAEPPYFARLGTVSSVPETYGADFLLCSPMGLVGVQRKALPDLVASVHDGRLQKELRQLRHVRVPLVVIEGIPTWNADGTAVGYAGWTKAQHYGVLWSLQLHQVWVVHSASINDTAEILALLPTWLEREHKGLLRRPPPPVGVWGTRDDAQWAAWLLQGFEGVGAELADRILDYFGGIPLVWSVTEDELRGVDGIGKVKARKLISALGKDNGRDEDQDA